MVEQGPVRPTGELALFDRWILSRSDAITAEVTRLLDTHQYGEAGRQLREFIWSELCDWYIEAAKVRLRMGGEAAESVGQTLAYVLERSLRLLHPFAPFATEILWQSIPHTGESIMMAPWPTASERDQTSEAAVSRVIEIVTKVRNARSESSVEPGRWIAARISAPHDRDLLESVRGEISTLARIADDQLAISIGSPAPEQTDAVIAVGDIVVVLPLAGMVDLDAERARVEKEHGAATAEIGRLSRQLDNPSFVERAPAKLVQDQRDRLAVVRQQVSVLEQRIRELSGHS
jgi:valyl-tRNA synthetase